MWKLGLYMFAIWAIINLAAHVSGVQGTTFDVDSYPKTYHRYN
jgi:hypothetical protein